MMQITQALKAALQTPRCRGALLVAVVSDSIGFGLGLIPPIQWVVDAVTVLVLLRVLGFSWPLMVALAVEAIPFLEVFPTWTLVVLVMAGTDKHSQPRSSG